MTSTDAVLDSIDGALRDFAVSREAMRWTPEPEAAAAEDAIWFDLTQAANVAALEEFGRQLSAMFAGMTASLGPLPVSLVKLAGTIAHLGDIQQRPRWHRRRCPECNPRGFTTPPAPEMRDYRRRLKARARRRHR